VRKHLRPLAMQASAAERAEKLRGQIASLEARIAQLDLASVAERRAETESRARRDPRGAGTGPSRAGAPALSEREGAEQELTDIAGSREATLAGLYRLRGAVERLEIRREAVEGLATELAFLHARSRQSGSARAGQSWCSWSAPTHGPATSCRRPSLGERELSSPCSGASPSWRGLERIELARLETESRALLEKRTKGGERPRRGRFAAGGAGRELFELAAAVERLSLRRESLGSSLGRSRQELSEAEALEQSGAPSYQEIEKAEARAAARERELAQECDRACERARHAAERLSVLERSIKEREGIPPAARALAEAGELLALTLLEVEPGYEQAGGGGPGLARGGSDRAGSKARLRFAGEGAPGGLGNLAVVLASGAASGPDRREAKEAAPLAGAVRSSSSPRETGGRRSCSKASGWCRSSALPRLARASSSRARGTATTPRGASSGSPVARPRR